MRKAIILLLILIIPVFVNAQTFKGQSEFSVSDGRESFQEFLGILGRRGGSSYTDKSNTTGSLFLSYRCYVGGRIAIGCVIGNDHFVMSSYENQGQLSDISAYNYTTIATEFLYNYLNNRWTRLYTLLGVGYSFVSVNESEYHNNVVNKSKLDGTVFNMQYTPFGVSVGGTLSGFAELGIGYKGFLNFGMSYRFPFHKPAMPEVKDRIIHDE